MIRPFRPNKPTINGPSRDAINKALGISGKGPVWVAGLVANVPQPSSQPSVSPTPTPTISATPTVTPTISVTPTITNTPTISLSPTNTPTISVSPTVTPTISLTPTNTPTPTISLTPTLTSTPTPSPLVSSITYITSTSSSDNLTTYTFNNVNIGGPGLIVVTISSILQNVASKSFSSATIGGVSATNVIFTTTDNQNYAGVISARITSGTTANISITMSSTMDNMSIGVYRIQNNTSDTVSKTGNGYNSGGSNSVGANLTSALANTLSVGVVASRLQVSPFTWTNATGNYGSNVDGFGSYGGASTKRVSAGTFAISATCTGTYQSAQIVVAGWV